MGERTDIALFLLVAFDFSSVGVFEKLDTGDYTFKELEVEVDFLVEALGGLGGDGLGVGVCERGASFRDAVVGALFVREDPGLDELFCWGLVGIADEGGGRTNLRRGWPLDIEIGVGGSISGFV